MRQKIIPHGTVHYIKIYGAIDVLMYTGCLLIQEELLFRGLKFLKQCSAANNTVVQYDFSTFGRTDLTSCVNEIGLNLRLYLSFVLGLRHDCACAIMPVCAVSFVLFSLSCCPLP